MSPRKQAALAAWLAEHAFGLKVLTTPKPLYFGLEETKGYDVIHVTHPEHSSVRQWVGVVSCDFDPVGDAGLSSVLLDKILKRRQLFSLEFRRDGRKVKIIIRKDGAHFAALTAPTKEEGVALAAKLIYHEFPLHP